jgi:hypothetical protein
MYKIGSNDSTTLPISLRYLRFFNESILVVLEVAAPRPWCLGDTPSQLFGFDLQESIRSGPKSG